MEMTLSVTHAAGASAGGVSATEGAGCTGKDKARTSRRSLFQKIECARDVGVNEALLTVRGDMRLCRLPYGEPRLPLSCIA